jgi:hypothetical protein
MDRVLPVTRPASRWGRWLQLPSAPPVRSPDFRRLLGIDAWQRLPVAVRARFAHEGAASRVIVYRGRMSVRASFFGRCLAHVCRMIGTPVAPHVDEDVPVTVRVFDRPDGSGTVWERRYDFAGRASVTVSSTKQMEDDGTLFEALGAGLRMRLRVFERDGALHFLSTGYFFQIGRLRIALPSWMPPGATHVIHEDLGGGAFRFTMRTTQPPQGVMYWQSGSFT